MSDRSLAKINLDRSLAVGRPWTKDEELANSASHAAGFLAALLGAPFLMATAMHHGGLRALGGGIFAGSCIFLYLCSALVHGLSPGRAQRVFEIMDYSGIFLLIAGTYTPFALGVLWGPWGWMLLSVIWPLAILGILIKVLRGVQTPMFTVSLYVAMGWFMVFFLRPLSLRVPAECLFLLLAGGAAYTGGLIFYFFRRMRYHHLAWHLAVLLGTTFHFMAVWLYAV